ncbi:MAG TPA: Yip1 family protein [Bacteroidales bacterium]|nr:Yip1 family protein [Bacteroidales bacterium]HNS47551.1 Yip1 family protein [Bacteroidales bacterium]
MNLIQRAKNILFNPKDEWKVIAEETPNAQSVVFSYVLPLALIPAIARFIGLGVFGFHMGRFAGMSGIGWGLASGIISLITTILAVYVAALIIDLLAPSFKSEKNFGRSMQLVGYSMTPMWVAGILYLIPVLGIVASLLGLYGIYLMYLGLGDIKKTPEDNKVGYLVVSAIVAIVVMWIISAVLMVIAGSVFFAGHAAYRMF